MPNDNDTLENNFDKVRQQLRFWPYTLHQIDDTLDTALIEGRGKQLLFRAVHSKNLTAFAGSGLSMSYGRLSWHEWVHEQQRVVRRTTERFLDTAEKALLWNKMLQELIQPNDKPEIEKKFGERTRAFREAHFFEEEPLVDLPLIQRDRHNAWQWLKTRWRAIESARLQIERLHQTFNLTQENDGHFPGGEELPVKFEIAQQLQNQLQRHVRLFLGPPPVGSAPPPHPVEAQRDKDRETAWPAACRSEESAAPREALDRIKEAYEAFFQLPVDLKKPKGIEHVRLNYEASFDKLHAVFCRPEAQQDFEKLAKSLLVDECPHALMLLRQGLLKRCDIDQPNEDGSWLEAKTAMEKLEDHLDVFNTSNQKREIEGIRQLSERYQVLSPFQLTNFEKLRMELPKEGSALWRNFCGFVETRLHEYIERTNRSGDKRSYLTPSSRFLVAVFLAIHKDPFEALGWQKDADGTFVDSKSNLKPPEKDAFTSRRSIIANRLDPLSKTDSQLGIRRYITTNYDFEIERFFQDQGYKNHRNSAHHRTDDDHLADDNFRRNNLGQALVDQSFLPEESAALTAFSVSDSNFDVGVFHLHGRATKDGSLVVTERDYMKLYLTQDEHRNTVDDAINVAFSGAPLLFLGLGMEETDLLRPLRQFISNRDRTIGYTSIALLPADKSLEARTKFASSLYLRYGVHTIFYGSGTTQYKGKMRGIDWLHRINLLIGALKAEVELWTKDELPKSESASKAVPNNGEYRSRNKPRGTSQFLRSRHDIGKTIFEAVKNIGPHLAEGAGYNKDTPAMNVMLGDPSISAETFGKVLHDQFSKSPETKTESGGDTEKTLWTNLGDFSLLKTCQFSPAKPAPTKNDPHKSESDVEVDGEEYAGFYTGILDHIMQAVSQLPETMTKAGAMPLTPRTALKKTERAEIAAPFLIALDGLRGAFVTASLNAALELVSREKDAWWVNWKMPPPHRLASAQRRSLSLKARLKPIDAKNNSMDAVAKETFYIRHQLHNSISVTKPEACDQDRVEVNSDELTETSTKDGLVRVVPKYRTRIRTFDTFIAAINCLNTKSNLLPDDAYKRRRLFTVAARRGMGKGTFFGAFSSTQGQAIYKAAAWPDKKVEFAGSIFINLGMSPEIASTYDMVFDAVVRSTAFIRQNRGPEPGEKPQDQKTLQDKIREKLYGLSRIEAMRQCFLEFSAEAGNEQHEKRRKKYRLLLSFSSVDLLYDHMRRPKNGEIDRILHLLFGDDLKDCPIDIIFVGDDTCLGEPWSLAPKKTGQVRLRLERDGLPDQADELVQRSIASSEITFDDTRKTSEISEIPVLKDENGDARWDVEETHFVHFTRPMNAIWVKIDNFFVLSVAMYLLNPPEEQRTSDGYWEDTFGRLVLEGRRKSDTEMDKLWASESLPTIGELDEARGLVQDEVAKGVFEYLAESAEAAEHMNVAAIEDDSSDEDKFHYLQMVLRERLKKRTNREDAQEWRDIRRNLGNSRFALTILMGAAEHIIVHAERAQNAARAAQDFIRDTVASVRGIGQERRDQLVLETVLASYRQYHRIGDPDLDCEFHMLILRHLGVIGTPVPSAVFVRLPDIRKYFENLGIEPPTSRRRFLVRALTTLAYRGLVFRVGPNPRLEELDSAPDNPAPMNDWPASMEYRYGLHRIVQSFALESLKSGVSDPVRNNSFAPTLYMVMPATGPSLSRETYNFLRRLVIALSQYPDIPNLDTSLEPWLFSTRDAGVRAQALRAALTLVRSIYSVSVISRLSDFKDNDMSVQKRGYMESYKVRLRWIIRMAWELLNRDEIKEENIPEGPFSHINALYRDEIVWLYNELGVISFTQGSLSDALGYLRQAAEENERVEGRSRSMPIYNHIDLNHAIVQMERGNFRSAENRLARVRGSTKERGWKLNWAARGYQCVLKHIRGERFGVAKDFEKVIRFFQESKETRSVALFTMHHARFIFDDDKGEAAKLVSRARNLAETDGHEDVRQQIELSKIRIETESNRQISTYASEMEVIGDVEDFARGMAIWSLQVDALRLRAALLLKQGETVTAGRFLIRAMAIAKRYSMNLRLNSAMTTYAETLRLRGDKYGAQKIASESLTRAKSTGYSLETARAQKVLRQCN